MSESPLFSSQPLTGFPFQETSRRTHTRRRNLPALFVGLRPISLQHNESRLSLFLGHRLHVGSLSSFLTSGETRSEHACRNQPSIMIELLHYGAYELLARVVTASMD